VAADSPIEVDLVVRGRATEAELETLIAEVERVAEIPRTIREAPPIEVRKTVIDSSSD
jgi:hypothetical protein